MDHLLDIRELWWIYVEQCMCDVAEYTQCISNQSCGKQWRKKIDCIIACDGGNCEYIP